MLRYYLIISVKKDRSLPLPLLLKLSLIYLLYAKRLMPSFWKNIKHVKCAKTPLASKINDCVGDNNICKMWQGHYQSILSSVNPIHSGEAFKAPPLRFFALTHLISKLHYCAWVFFLKKIV